MFVISLLEILNSLLKLLSKSLLTIVLMKKKESNYNDFIVIQTIYIDKRKKSHLQSHFIIKYKNLY